MAAPSFFGVKDDFLTPNGPHIGRQWEGNLPSLWDFFFSIFNRQHDSQWPGGGGIKNLRGCMAASSDFSWSRNLPNPGDFRWIRGGWPPSFKLGLVPACRKSAEFRTTVTPEVRLLSEEV